MRAGLLIIFHSQTEHSEIEVIHCFAALIANSFVDYQRLYKVILSLLIVTLIEVGISQVAAGDCQLVYISNPDAGAYAFLVMLNGQ